MLLAVDGGGTKTHVLLTDYQGGVLGTSQSGPLNFTVAGRSGALHNLYKALESIQQQRPAVPLTFKKVLIGLAGVDTPKEIEYAKNFFSKALEPQYHCSVEVVNDTEIALASGSIMPNALVIIAGTGSNCYGRNFQGNVAKAGGLDYLLSDEGSGYWMGREVLHAAVKSADGRGEKTILEDLIKKYFVINEISQLKAHVYKSSFTKADIANLSMLTVEAKKEHDQVALHLLSQAAEELSALVIAVGKQLNFTNTAFDLVMVGSMFHHKVIPIADFKQYVSAVFPRVTFIEPTYPPVYGALKLLLTASK